MAEQVGGAGDQVKIGPRIGRWEERPDGSVSLIAARCASCGETSFPAYRVCPSCRSALLEEVRLEGPARLYSFTVVHQLPSGFPAPLTIGYGEFSEGILVLAPIDVPAGEVVPGMLLALAAGVTRIDEDGEAMSSYRFRPYASKAEPSAAEKDLTDA